MCMENPVIGAPEGELIQGEVMDLGIDADEAKADKSAKYQERDEQEEQDENNVNLDHE